MHGVEGVYSAGFTSEGKISSLCACTTMLRRVHAASARKGVNIHAAGRSAPVCDCAWGWQGAVGRDGKGGERRSK
jgi:hypothetical protein